MPASKEDGECGAGAEGVGDGEAVFAGGGVIVIAEEEDFVGEGADVAVGGFDEGEAEVGRFVIDAEEVAGDFAFGCEQDQGGGMDVLLGGGHPSGSGSRRRR